LAVYVVTHVSINYKRNCAVYQCMEEKNFDLVPEIYNKVYNCYMFLWTEALVDS